MRIVFINRFYWPDEPATGQLLTDLAEALAAQGHEVLVITSRPNGAGVAATETRAGVQIFRVRSTRWAAGLGLIGKAVDFTTFLLRATLAVRREANSGTVVVAMTDPPLLAVGAWLATSRRARLIHWVQDIYPELAIELSGQRALAVFQPWRNRAWRAADACVTLGREMADVIHEAGVADARIQLIPNPAPLGLGPAPTNETDALRRAWGLTGKFVVEYSGNLGRVHDLEPVLAAADALRSQPDIVVLFIGEGAQRATLEAEAQRRSLPNIQFRPPQPRSALRASLGVGDLHLVTLRPGCERYVYPSKLQGVFAAGRGVIFIGPRHSDPARLVETSGAGLAFTRDETERMTTELIRLARSPADVARFAENAARAAHSTTATLSAWTQLLATLSPAPETAAAAAR